MKCFENRLSFLAGFAFQRLRQDRRGSGGDGATGTLKTDVRNAIVHQRQIDGDLIAAEGVIAIGVMVSIRDRMEIPRPLGVIENDILIEVA